jgi:hypothetical protein
VGFHFIFLNFEMFWIIHLIHFFYQGNFCKHLKYNIFKLSLSTIILLNYY